MDPFFKANSLFHRHKFDECIDICTDLLDKNPYDQAIWVLKMRAMTQRVYVDDLESEDLNPDGDFLDDNAISSAPRPGTSLRTVATGLTSSRPRTATGRPLSGVVRPGTQSRPGSSAIDRLKTSRPFTTQSARTIRLGTAAMLSAKDGPFIQVSRLNLTKYAENPSISKPLFEYLYYHDGDIRNAMELAVQATQHCQFKDWWWKVQLAKCYLSLNLIRDAEQQLKSALTQQDNIEIIIRLVRIYIRLDQPLTAINVCKSGLEKFPSDVSIQTELARLYESLGDSKMSIAHYKSIVILDAMNVEAIACIGLHHFYTDQPEIALRYYRRILQMGVNSAELYNNLGLCCLYAQQLDLTLACFKRALDLAIEPEVKAEVWFNLSHVAISSGDLELARNCLNLSLLCDPTNAQALNNLAVIEHRFGRGNIAKSYFQTAHNLDSGLMEPETNLILLRDL